MAWLANADCQWAPGASPDGGLSVIASCDCNEGSPRCGSVWATVVVEGPASLQLLRQFRQALVRSTNRSRAGSGQRVSGHYAARESRRLGNRIRPCCRRRWVGRRHCVQGEGRGVRRGNDTPTPLGEIVPPASAADRLSSIPRDTRLQLRDSPARSGLLERQHRARAF